MWMNGSRSRRSTPAKARRTGKPSPSKPEGAVVTVRVRRRTVPGAGRGTRARVVVSSTVTAGMPASLVEVSTSGDCSAAGPRCLPAMATRSPIWSQRSRYGDQIADVGGRRSAERCADGVLVPWAQVAHGRCADAEGARDVVVAELAQVRDLQLEGPEDVG